MNKTNQKLSPTQVLQITNTLYSLGLKPSNFGTKLINKTIQYIISNELEFFKLEEIYNYLQDTYNINSKTIKSNINNAITNRNNKKTMINFKKIFGYDYDETVFTSKNFIEELIRILYL